MAKTKQKISLHKLIKVSGVQKMTGKTTNKDQALIMDRLKRGSYPEMEAQIIRFMEEITIDL
jgi:hypothetical protein